MLKRYTYRRRNSLCVLLSLHTVLLFMHFSLLLLLLLLPSLSPMACMAQTMALYECGGIGVGSHRTNHAWSRPGRHLPTCSVHQSVCMCKCMYVQMYVCASVCMYKCMYVQVMYCVSVLMFKCMYCTNVCTYKCMYVCASVCMCKHACWGAAALIFNVLSVDFWWPSRYWCIWCGDHGVIRHGTVGAVLVGVGGCGCGCGCGCGWMFGWVWV